MLAATVRVTGTGTGAGPGRAHGPGPGAIAGKLQVEGRGCRPPVACLSGPWSRVWDGRCWRQPGGAGFIAGPPPGCESDSES